MVTQCWFSASEFKLRQFSWSGQKSYHACCLRPHLHHRFLVKKHCFRSSFPPQQKFHVCVATFLKRCLFSQKQQKCWKRFMLGCYRISTHACLETRCTCAAAAFQCLCLLPFPQRRNFINHHLGSPSQNIAFSVALRTVVGSNRPPKHNKDFPF